MRSKVLVGATIRVHVKGRQLRYVTSFKLEAKPRSVCHAKVKYFECNEKGGMITVELPGGKRQVKENEFGAFVTGIREENGRFIFDVMPRSFVSGKQNDFTNEDEKFLLAEILKSCAPETASVEAPQESL